MPRVEVARSNEVFEGEFHAAKVGGYTVLVTRSQGKLCAIENKCPHLGFPIARGKLEGGAIRCPWHGSRFSLCTGENLDWVNSVAGIGMPKWSHGLIAFGKLPAPIRTFKVSERNGTVFVTVPSD